MKWHYFAALLGILAGTPVFGTTISFLSPTTGVDADTSAWSHDGNVVDLGSQSYSLLGGAATVAGYQDGSPFGVSLSQTGTRGLGIWDEGAIPVENDELDNFGGVETLHIDFNGVPYAINSLEVRSLFNSNPSQPNTDYLGRLTPPEHAFIDFYLGGSLIQTTDLVGSEFLGTANGVESISYATPVIADLLVFRVPTSADLGLPAVDHNDDPYTFTDFAVAQLDVTSAGTAVPLPPAAFAASPLLLLLGLNSRLSCQAFSPRLGGLI